jgi:hypothetical protein
MPKIVWPGATGDTYVFAVTEAGIVLVVDDTSLYRGAVTYEPDDAIALAEAHETIAESLRAAARDVHAARESRRI